MDTWGCTHLAGAISVPPFEQRAVVVLVSLKRFRHEAASCGLSGCSHRTGSLVSGTGPGRIEESPASQARAVTAARTAIITPSWTPSRRFPHHGVPATPLIALMFHRPLPRPQDQSCAKTVKTNLPAFVSSDPSSKSALGPRQLIPASAKTGSACTAGARVPQPMRSSHRRPLRLWRQSWPRSQPAAPEDRRRALASTSTSV